ncbi:unnamed protein product [Heterobilharzia americana]|nr:unnamed protein product [Heterobilharzia americana]
MKQLFEWYILNALMNTHLSKFKNPSKFSKHYDFAEKISPHTTTPYLRSKRLEPQLDPAFSILNVYIQNQCNLLNMDLVNLSLLT